MRRLVLLHGVGSSAKAWEPLRPFLDEYELVALDLPGFGSAPPLPRGIEASIPAHADVVERELDARGIEVADLVGNSSGGWLALELARRGRARTVTALSPAGMWRGWERHYVFASLRMARAVAHVLAPRARWLMQFAPLRLPLWQYFGRPLRLRPADAAEAICAMGQAKSFHHLIAWTSRHHPSGLDRITAPVLVAWGEKDRLLFGRQAERFVAAIPRSQLVRLPGVGHVPMQDDPELVAGVIRRFVSGSCGEQAAVGFALLPRARSSGSLSTCRSAC